MCVCVGGGGGGGWGGGTCVRAAGVHVYVRARIYEYVGVVPYMDATFKVSRLAE